MDKSALDHRFKYHKPDEARAKRHESVRNACRQAAGWIEHHCPEGREKSLAMTKLEEAMMWANAAIAREPHE